MKNKTLKNFIKTGFLVIVLLAGYFNFGFLKSANAGECKATISFDVKPKPARFNQPVTLSGSVSLAGSVFEPPGSANAGYCMWDTVLDKRPVTKLYVVFEPIQTHPITGHLVEVVNTITLNVTPSSNSPMAFSTSIVPSEKGYEASTASSIKSINFRAHVQVNTVLGAANPLSKLTSSDPVNVVLTEGVYSAYGCARSDGTYACSPGNVSNCSDAPECGGKSCVVLTDSKSCQAVYACNAGGVYACSSKNSTTDSACSFTSGCSAASKAECKKVPLTACGQSVNGGAPGGGGTAPKIKNGQKCVDGSGKSGSSLCESNFCENGTGACESCQDYEEDVCGTSYTCTSAGICVKAGTGGGAGGGDGSMNGNSSSHLFNPLPEDDLGHTFLLILQGLLGMLGVLATVFIVVGGVQMVVSAGSEEAITKAKKTITWAVLGLLAALLSFSIVAIVQDLLQASLKPTQPTIQTTTNK